MKLILALLLTGCVSASTASSFVVYDSLLFDNKPNTGLKQITNVAPGVRFFNPKPPTEAEIRTIAASLSSSIDRDIYFFDIEVLPTATTDTKLDKAESIIKLSEIAYWFKTERPSIRIGYYVVLPERQYWKRDREWRQRNAYFKPLANYVDFVSPSLYTFYEDQQGWVEYAIANIKEAKKYGKPVYPFIWPQYHNSSALAGQLIPGDYWRVQLETIYEYADGVVIWGGWQVDWDSSISETDPTNWWFQTLDFIQKKGL